MELRPLIVRSKIRAPRSAGTPGPSSVTSIDGLVAGDAGAQRDRAAAVHEGVLDQRGQHLGDRARGADRLQMPLAGADDGPALAAVGRAPLLQLLLDDLVEVEGDGGAGARVAGVGEQPLDDVREPLDLRRARSSPPPSPCPGRR